jgi:phosphonoacetaldehyde hydrolase
MAIQAVILDWAGTTVDHGCQAPAGAFVALFREHGVEVPLSVARGPMGAHKREHLRALLAWAQGARLPDEDALYARLTALQVACLPDHAAPVPGCVEAIAALRARGVRIGSTTGYTAKMLAALAPAAAAQGYRPDVAVTADEVPAGRPAPYMALRAMERLGVWPVQVCVKVGDTPLDVDEGRNAGMWTVGVMLTGNVGGLTAAELARSTEAEREALRARARAELGGAHLLIDGVADLPAAVATLEERIRRGERP